MAWLKLHNLRNFNQASVVLTSSLPDWPVLPSKANAVRTVPESLAELR